MKQNSGQCLLQKEAAEESTNIARGTTHRSYFLCKLKSSRHVSFLLVCDMHVCFYLKACVRGRLSSFKSLPPSLSIISLETVPLVKAQLTRTAG